VRNTNAKWVYLNGTWQTTDSAIQQAIDAWTLGDGPATSWASILEAFNAEQNQLIIDP
jgi:hypothetical protein